ncbi:2-hydroxyacid dehydrogenase [Pseudohalocynthiibacter aestuariivivens]|jgi:glyoxylate/hydroxypyruvate reductase|uniref:2-hydroxyacid dehydrogenase n=1 Tax=Pseudohalocynthiibacter aestuariivivens TaxID=1591409 RepID=A0ABV5JH39_9RHOB|nr:MULTISPECIES: glyoxylate/hydroxypyruvate reductase A [Pseudohalocynthiibacter]MBS9718474.1 glyoxylate/hydroxypyruvate reductase A [Pseudohalocynthiibacter aestuariivivens]MCK0104057.1 glyoxylate/hydroxypyruvate reductase A [Pseudohalocynthiibacter sp. F2068]
MIHIYFAAKDVRWDEYEAPLRKALDEKGLSYSLSDKCDDPSIIDYIVYAPNGPLKDFSPFSRAKAVLSLWAGVEDVVGNPTLKIPLARMVDSGLSEGMVEWVTGHVLRHHLGMDLHIHGQDGVWRDYVPPLARTRTVGILGLGALGQACGEALSALNFNVLGWSKSKKQLDNITCHSGEEGLKTVLRSSEILVLLLPKTPETENILNIETLALMPKGAKIINPGRGPLINDDALLAALDSGQTGHATLDVFRIEPLPADHPYWAHPNVTVTPHIASETRSDTASQVIAENIRRGEAGLPYLHLVNRTAGY